MPDPNLSALAAQLDTAQKEAPLPWTVRDNSASTLNEMTHDFAAIDASTIGAWAFESNSSKALVEFIVSAVNALPALIRDSVALGEARAEVERLRAIVLDAARWFQREHPVTSQDLRRMGAPSAEYTASLAAIKETP